MEQMIPLISDTEFAALRGFFLAHNTKLAGNTGAMIAELAKFDATVDTDLLPNIKQNGVENTMTAICITLQGRNFLARMLGEPQRSMPEIPGQAPSLPDPIEKKLVAIWVGGGDNYFTRAATLILAPNDRCVIFKSVSALVTEILMNNICGVISLSDPRSVTNVESLIRHELKNSPGWSYERAQKFLLPPCADHTLLAPLLIAMGEMLKGTFGATAGSFDLASSIPSLLPNMYMPLVKQRRVIVVDDCSNDILGVNALLDAWPKIELQAADYGRDFKTMKLDGNEIFLLDEHLGGVTTGTKIAQALKQRDRYLITASISGGQRPEFATHHFQAKTAIMKDRSAAQGFIRFMNAVLKEADR